MVKCYLSGVKKNKNFVSVTYFYCWSATLSQISMKFAFRTGKWFFDFHELVYKVYNAWYRVEEVITKSAAVANTHSNAHLSSESILLAWNSWISAHFFFIAIHGQDKVNYIVFMHVFFLFVCLFVVVFLFCFCFCVFDEKFDPILAYSDWKSRNLGRLVYAATGKGMTKWIFPINWKEDDSNDS